MKTELTNRPIHIYKHKYGASKAPYDRGSTINQGGRKTLGGHLEKNKTAVDPYLTSK